VSRRSKADGVHRLEDIVVEEVSLVDRAANKHRFLIVKREDGVFDDDDNEDGEEGTTAKGDARTGAAIAALEGLISIVELLSSAGADDPRIPELASELRTTAEQLAGSAADAEKARKKPKDGEEADEDTEKERKKPKPGEEPDDTEKARKKPPGEALDDPPPDDGENGNGGPAPAKKKPSKKQAAQVEAGLAAAKSLLAKLAALKPGPQAPSPTSTVPPIAPTELTKLTEAITALNKSMTDHQQRLGNVEKHVGLPNSAPPGERVTKNEKAAPSWPLDLNRPKGRENVDKTLSFHDL